MNAQAIILFDDQGRIMASAGFMQEDYNSHSLIESLLPILASIRNLSRLNDQQEYTSWHFFSGGKNDIIFSPLDTNYSLVLSGVKKEPDKQAVTNIGKFIKSRQAILDQIRGSEDSPQPQLNTADEDGPIDLTAEIPNTVMEPIVEQLGKKIPTDELDSFWDDAIEKYTSLPIPGK